MSIAVRAGVGLLLLAPARLLPGLQIPRPAFSLDFSAGGDLERNSDTMLERKPSYAYWAGLYGSARWWVFDAGLNLRYTSDDHFTAQRVHNFSFTPAWNWGRIYLGDFSTSFSQFTLTGVPLLGGGLELFPGSFRFGAVAGRTKRASTDPYDWTYDRWLYALRIGFEQFSVIVLKAADNLASNRSERIRVDTLVQLDSLGWPIDTLVQVDTLVSVPAQENLVLGLNSWLRLAPGLGLDLEAGGSLFTRDQRSDTFRHERIPEFAYRLYNPRMSTMADYALRAGLRYSPSFMSISFEAAQVGPGYTSLGLSGVHNDYRHLRVDASTSAIPRTTLAAYAERGSDNLAGDKVATSVSDILGFSVSVSPIRQLSLAGNYNLTHTVKDDDSSVVFDLDTRTQSISGGPNLNLDISGFVQTVGLSASYLTYDNLARLNATPATRTLTLALNYSIRPRLPITLSTSFSQTFDFSDSLPTGVRRQTQNYQSYSLGAGKAFFNERLQNSLAIAFQPSSTGNCFPISGNHSYAITKRDIVNLDWTLTFYKSRMPGSSGFNSQRVGLSYSRRLI